ncbi:MAG: hypothetical protein U0R65_10550 [Candidatus Nanopelagicales bacterium]
MPAVILLVVITAAFGVALVWVGLGGGVDAAGPARHSCSPSSSGGSSGVSLAQSDGTVERVTGIALVLAALIGLVLSFAPAVNRRLAD